MQNNYELPPIKGNDPSCVTIITKTVTPNAGNQALSTELFRLVKTKYPSSQIFHYWRVPGLEQYTMPRLARGGSDPLQTLDRWVDAIIEKYGPTSLNESEETVTSLRELQKSKVPDNLDRYIKVTPLLKPNHLSKCLQKVKTVLRRLYRYVGPYRSCFRKWLRLLKVSDIVIYSPAGIMLDQEAYFILHDLIILRIAQKFGAKVFVVNQSFEINNEYLKKLVVSLYDSFDRVTVRDPISRERLINAGLPRKKLKLVPDTAYLASYTHNQRILASGIDTKKIKPSTVAICVQLRQNINWAGWDKVINHLISLNKKVIFVSHQISSDREIALAFSKMFGIEVIDQQYDYESYIELLSLFELVISERYHTCVFSALAGVPFIPIQVFGMSKMHGLTAFLNYPISSISTDANDFGEEVIRSIQKIYIRYLHTRQSMNEKIPIIRQAARQNVV